MTEKIPPENLGLKVFRICPLGLLSDLLTRLRTALGIEEVRLSRRARDGLVVTKYMLLALALGGSPSVTSPSISPGATAIQAQAMTNPGSADQIAT